MSNREQIVQLVASICEMNKGFLKGFRRYTSEIRKILESGASQREQSRRLFDPLMTSFSFAGVSDKVAKAYIEEHGGISYFQITRRLNQFKEENGKLCGKLQNSDTFKGCGFKKSRKTCNNPVMYSRCPLPTHDLRNGLLNQKAYSFYFFIRDLCDRDLITHIDLIIESHLDSSDQPGWQEAERAANALVQSFRRIVGVKDKLASMTLADLLMASGRKPKWLVAAQSMVAVDTLVHNFLHRTGALKAFKLDHHYGGKACHERCSLAIHAISKEIDASTFNNKHPKYFPRFVQHSIWSFCAEEGQDICNSNNIVDESKPCEMGEDCPANNLCEKIPLRAKPRTHSLRVETSS